ESHTTRLSSRRRNYAHARRSWHRNPGILALAHLQTSRSRAGHGLPVPQRALLLEICHLWGTIGLRFRTDGLFFKERIVVEETVTLADVYAGWDDFNKKLVESLAPLTSEQLDLRVAPTQRSAREIILHLVRVRASWFELLGATDPEWTSYLTW